MTTHDTCEPRRWLPVLVRHSSHAVQMGTLEDWLEGGPLVQDIMQCHRSNQSLSGQ